MKRSHWIILALGGALAALLAFFRPRPPEEFPLAELVPADAIGYAGFPHYREWEEIASSIPGGWTPENRERFEKAKPHLSGALAFYVDARREWVGLARLTRGAALVGGADVVGDAAVFAQSPAALERFRSRSGTILEVPAFRRLRSRFFVNLDAFDLKGRLADCDAVAFEIVGRHPLAIRGRASYRPDRFRMYLERYVQAPRRAGTAEAGPPVQLALTDPVPRLWDEILEGLAPDDRERVDRETQILRRDVLGGRDVRDFLARLGPRWGLSAVASPQGFPALVGWLDLPDAESRATLEELLQRGARDWERLLRGRGQGPWVEVEKKDGLWRLKFPKAVALRLGEAFTPAYGFDGNRLVFTSCAAAFPSPAPADGEAHEALSVNVAATLDLLRAMVPYFTDDFFRTEADGMALARYLREYNPVALGLVARRYPDPYEREKFLSTRRAELVAEALGEIAKGQKYKDEIARCGARISAWAERLRGVDRVALTGRFSGGGLEFELRVAGPR